MVIVENRGVWEYEISAISPSCLCPKLYRRHRSHVPSLLCKFLLPLLITTTTDRSEHYRSINHRLVPYLSLLFNSPTSARTLSTLHKSLSPHPLSFTSTVKRFITLHARAGFKHYAIYHFFNALPLSRSHLIACITWKRLSKRSNVTVSSYTLPSLRASAV